MSSINCIVRDVLKKVEDNIFKVLLAECCISSEISDMYNKYYDNLQESPVKVFDIIDEFMFNYLKYGQIIHPADGKDKDNNNKTEYTLIFSKLDTLPIDIKCLIKRKMKIYLKTMMINLLTTYHGLEAETKFKNTKLPHLVAFEYFYRHRNYIEEDGAKLKAQNPKAFVIIMDLLTRYKLTGGSTIHLGAITT